MAENDETQEQLEVIPPHPLPGWISVAKIEETEGGIQDVSVKTGPEFAMPIPGKKGAVIAQHIMEAMVQGAPDITTAFVVEIGDYPRQWYEMAAETLHQDPNELITYNQKCPYAVGAKVWFRSERGFDVDGLTYLEWNSPFAWRPGDE